MMTEKPQAVLVWPLGPHRVAKEEATVGDYTFTGAQSCENLHVAVLL